MPRYSLSHAEVESTRQRLCTTALALFREGGIDAVTFRGLADAAGASHTLPYRYFENKEPAPGRPTDPERERQILQLMTQALIAVLNNREEEQNEPT
jgi:AcrR family transcriptional regulator